MRFSLPETISSLLFFMRVLIVLGDLYEKEDENDKIFVPLPLLLSISSFTRVFLLFSGSRLSNPPSSVA